MATVTIRAVSTKIWGLRLDRGWKIAKPSSGGFVDRHLGSDRQVKDSPK
jgi:hypothetical protein